MKALKWMVLAIILLTIVAGLIDIGYGVADLQDSRIAPPMEREFRILNVGLTQQQVLTLFGPKLPQRPAKYYLDVGSKIDTWHFEGSWSCYTVNFDPATHFVRGRIIRWFWEKLDEVR